MQEINKKFMGTWRLVHYVEINSSSNKSYPLGEDAIGYIMYDSFGKMAVQVCRKEIPHANDKLILPENYIAYFGDYEIDTENEIISHTMTRCH
jgi:Lipocalin-like domain